MSHPRMRLTGRLFLFAFLSSYGCGSTSKAVAVDESADGREVNLKIGQILELSLPETPSTGFLWFWKTKPDAWCTLISTRHEYQRQGIVPPGSPGTRSWQFRASQAGTAKIELQNYRPGDEASVPPRQFRLTVHVRKSN